MTAPTEVDAEILDSLTHAIGDEGVREIIDIFRDDAPGRLADFHRGLEKGDLKLSGRAVHTLKSTASYLGARRFSRFCDELEVKARADDATSLCDALPELERRLSGLIEELTQARNKASSG